MRHVNRRQFLDKSLRDAAGISLGAATLSLARPRRVLGANGRVNIALIGCGGRGRYVARGMIEQGATVTYLCDLHNDRLDKTAAFLAEVQPRKPKLVKDMREGFDDKDVNAVIVATPDHWHALATILACQANKDVYVEKPLSRKTPATGVYRKDKCEH